MLDGFLVLLALREEEVEAEEEKDRRETRRNKSAGRAVAARADRLGISVVNGSGRLVREYQDAERVDEWSPYGLEAVGRKKVMAESWINS